MFNALYKPEATLLQGAHGPGGAMNARAFPHPARRIDLLLTGGQGSTVSGLRQFTHLLCIFQNVVAGPCYSSPSMLTPLFNAFAVLSVRLGEGVKRTMCVESIILNQEVCPYELEN